MIYSDLALIFGAKVASFYSGESTREISTVFQFAYEISIHNSSDVQVQLISRHWWITDQFNKTTEVSGEGVVGKQPVIKPMHTFTYSSGAALPTPVGTMHGTYTMVAETGLKFDVAITEFVLACKQHIH